MKKYIPTPEQKARQRKKFLERDIGRIEFPKEIVEAIKKSEKPKPGYRVVCPLCHKTAFYVMRMPNKGDIIESSNFILLNGHPPNPLDHIACGSCKKYYDTIEIEWIQKITNSEKENEPKIHNI